MIAQDFDSVTLLNCTILSGQTASDAIPLYGTTIGAILVSSAVTSSLMAFSGSIDGGLTYKNMINSTAGTFAMTLTADNIIPMDNTQQTYFKAIDFVKIIVNSAEAAPRIFKIKPTRW